MESRIYFILSEVYSDLELIYPRKPEFGMIDFVNT